MPNKTARYLIAVALLWLVFAQAVRGAVISSTTFDEGPHLAVGYATLRTGDFRLQPVHIHPPLANLLAAAPLLLDPSLPDPRSIPGWEIASLSALTDALVWQHTPPDGLVFAGRLPIILLTVLLGAFAYRWATDLGGRRAGRLALFLCALDPNMIAHGQVITTDMGVTVAGFVALYCLYKFQISNLKSQRRWLAGVGLALGAALAVKVSAGLLVPLLAALILLSKPGHAARRVGRVALVGILAFVVVWAVYGFELGRVPGLPFPIPAATHVKIYQSLQQHYGEGHPSFLLGMNSTRGWWYYFPVAFLVKTPLPTLILLAAAVALAILRGRQQEARGKRQEAGSKAQEAAPGKQEASHTSRIKWVNWTLLLFPVAHFATAFFSSVNIGYRHLLPSLPFLFVFIGWQVAGHRSQVASYKSQVASRITPPISRFTFHVSRFTFYVLLAWYAIGAAAIFPHHLAYFNEIAGGPDKGYAWLVDSNLDWGQNLKELGTWLDARGIAQVYLSQFSPSRPEVYGLPATPLLPSPRAVSIPRFNPPPGWYAIGATTLQGVYTPDADTFAYFRAMTPAARIGHALFVYHVEEQPRGTWVAQCARPASPLNADEIKTGFEAGDVRSIHFDCSTSWWYPATRAPGWYVARPDGPSLKPDEWYAGAQTIFASRSTHSPSALNIMRVERPVLPALVSNVQSGASAVSTPVTSTGPLRLEGFRSTGQLSARPGGQVTLYTVWQVTRPADAPLSIMAHLTDAQGRLIAGADGLGVPVQVWQAGDVIVQAHTFAVPPDTAPGRYQVQTGLYRLDTMERYQILQAGRAVGDQLGLASVEVKP